MSQDRCEVCGALLPWEVRAMAGTVCSSQCFDVRLRQKREAPRFSDQPGSEHERAEWMRTMADNLQRERNDLRVKVEEQDAEIVRLRAEVRAYKEQWDAEVAGSQALREECGARPDETYPDFVRRLYEEATTWRDVAKGGGAEALKDLTAERDALLADRERDRKAFDWWYSWCEASSAKHIEQTKEIERLGECMDERDELLAAMPDIEFCVNMLERQDVVAVAPFTRVRQLVRRWRAAFDINGSAQRGYAALERLRRERDALLAAVKAQVEAERREAEVAGARDDAAHALRTAVALCEGREP